MTLTYLLVFLALAVTPVEMKGDTVDDSPQARQLFKMADLDANDYLTYGEFQHLFRAFDEDNDGNVTSIEFLTYWTDEGLGPVDQGVQLFVNLDVTKDLILEISVDLPYVFRWFDTNEDMKIHEGEFVIQWVKISS